MGLDWIVGHKPAPGHEAAGWTALHEALAAPDDDRKLKRWLGTPSVAAWVTVGAPQVGSDRAAQAWFLAKLRNTQEAVDPDTATAEERAAIDANAGFYVVELAPRCDGTPPYSHGGLYEGVDATSFRGAFLHDAEDVLDDDLLARAYDRMLPDDLRAYGDALQAAARIYAEREGVVAEAAAFEPPEDPDSPAAKAHVVASAARWCLYWAQRGHWKDVWF